MALLVGWLVYRLRAGRLPRGGAGAGGRAAPRRARAARRHRSTRQTAAPARSAPRSSSTRRSEPSSGSCAGSSRSTGRRSSFPTRAHPGDGDRGAEAHDEVLPPGRGLPPGALIEEVLSTGETVVSARHADARSTPRRQRSRDRPAGLGSLRRCSSACGRSACSSILRREPDSFDPGRDRARHPARPPGCDGGAEHPALRGRAVRPSTSCGGCRAPRRLRLAGLSRAA